MAKEKKIKKIHLADMEPLFMIGAFPRATIRFCLMFKPLMYYFFIGIVAAFSEELILFFDQKYPFQFSLGEIVSTAMYFSVISYVLSTVIISFLLNAIGKMVGGKGTFKQMFRAITLTNIPLIWILPVILFWMQLSPESFFQYGDFPLSTGDVVMHNVGAVLIFVATAWCVFLTFKAVQEVERVSIKKTFGILALTVVTFVVLNLALYAATGFTIL